MTTLTTWDGFLASLPHHGRDILLQDRPVYTTERDAAGTVGRKLSGHTYILAPESTFARFFRGAWEARIPGSDLLPAWITACNDTAFPDAAPRCKGYCKYFQRWRAEGLI